jgi:hypothetical protein
MAALFVANGPDIRPSVRLESFDNVSVYPLLARLLGVTPLQSEGRAEDTAAALRQDHGAPPRVQTGGRGNRRGR